MPSLEREAAPAGPRVDAFVGTGFRVDGTIYSTGLKLTSSIAWDWNAPSIDQLTESDLADLLDLQPSPEFVLLGTGHVLSRPAPSLVLALESKGVGVEVMDSRAAARAWGVLRGEGRSIVAALLPLR